jgi:hypothetical protein
MQANVAFRSRRSAGRRRNVVNASGSNPLASQLRLGTLQFVNIASEPRELLPRDDIRVDQRKATWLYAVAFGLFLLIRPFLSSAPAELPPWSIALLWCAAAQLIHRRALANILALTLALGLFGWLENEAFSFGRSSLVLAITLVLAPWTTLKMNRRTRFVDRPKYAGFRVLLLVGRDTLIAWTAGLLAMFYLGLGVAWTDLADSLDLLTSVGVPFAAAISIGALKDHVRWSAKSQASPT